MIYQVKNNDTFKRTYVIHWDGSDDTLELINAYLNEIKNETWSACRAWNDDTGRNDSDTLVISQKFGSSISNCFYELGDYLLDKGSYFHQYSKKELDDENIELKLIARKVI